MPRQLREGQGTNRENSDIDLSILQHIENHDHVSHIKRVGIE